MRQRLIKSVLRILCLVLLAASPPFAALAGPDFSPVSQNGAASSGGTEGLTVSYDANGASEGTVPNTVTYAPGAAVSVSGNTGALAKAGYAMNGWNTKADGTGATYYAGTTFPMPDASVVLYANWVKKAVIYDQNQWQAGDWNYTVAYSASGDNNTIVPTSYYNQQAGVVLYKTPAAGSYGAKNHFIGFRDVSQDFWASEYIWFLSARSVVSGVGGGLYAPEQIVTRAAFVKMLAKITPGLDLSRVPDAGFADVPSTEWYAPYVNWAAANGITAGYNGKFSPYDPITREQMCKMIDAYTSHIGYPLGSTGEPTAFGDEDSVSAWALDSVKALQRSGLIAGSDSNFNPKGLSTRAAAAAVVCRLLMGILSVTDNPSAIPIG